MQQIRAHRHNVPDELDGIQSVIILGGLIMAVLRAFAQDDTESGLKWLIIAFSAAVLGPPSHGQDFGVDRRNPPNFRV